MLLEFILISLCLPCFVITILHAQKFVDFEYVVYLFSVDLNTIKRARLIRILHVFRTLSREAGGPATLVPALCLELADQGHDVTLGTLAVPDDGNVEPAVETSVVQLPSGSIPKLGAGG